MARRSLILRDSLTFLALTFITVALFGVTLFLFRSFAAHRLELGRRWSDRGRVALAAGQPALAISALRTALSYAPGERPYEFLLAQALAAGGHTEEANSYFTSLWDTEPGNGFVNLQLARLAAARNDPGQATNFYRASIDGTWTGDGVLRRRSVRLELANYLLQQRNTDAARSELIIAAGNAGNDPIVSFQLAQLFERVGDTTDALAEYDRTLAARPHDADALAAAGRLAWRRHEFARAQKLLQRSLQAGPLSAPVPQASSSDRESLLAQVDRAVDLLPFRSLPNRERVRRLIHLKSLANERLTACSAVSPAPMSAAAARWSISEKAFTERDLLRDSAQQDQLLQLLSETELDVEKACPGADTVENTPLLLLAQDSKVVDQK